jgi:hypothetical protein
MFPDAFAVTSSTGASVATSTSVDYTKVVNARGDRLPDFSYCGYHASETRLPPIDSTANLNINAGPGNQVSRIQTALNQVSAAGGGVVALCPGTFEMSGTLTMPNNTILRGAGIGNSILALSEHNSTFISMGNANTGKVMMGASTNIIDSYVPVGTSELTVASTSGFTVGQTIFVQRKASASWIEANGMNTLVRDGRPQTWIKVRTFYSQINMAVSLR